MNDDTDRDRAIARARKLLTQAEHPNTSAEERQAFAAKAAEIMLLHDLTEAVVRAAAGNTETDSIDMLKWVVAGTGGHGRHRAWALGAAAQAYGCAVCYTANDAGIRARTVNIVGASSDLQSLRMLLPTVAALAETTAAQAADNHRRHLRAEGWYTDAELRRETTNYRRSFLRAFGQGVAAQIGQRREQVVQQLSTAVTGGALVLAGRDARAKAELARRFPKLRTVRARATSDYGHSDGYTAGRTADLGASTTLTGPSRAGLPAAKADNR